MSAATATVPPESELELQHVLFFHRHGDRSPILTTIGANWKTTPEEMAFWRARVATPDELDKLSRFAKVVGDDPSMPPHGVPRHRDMAPLAQLTSIGVEHMFGKGRALRAKYDSFLETHGVKDAPHESVYVLSSNVDRTIQSVQCLLYGMFDGDKADANKERELAFYVRTYERNILAPEHPIEIFFRLEEVVSEDVAKRDPAERLKMEQLGEKLKVIAGVPADKKVPWTAIRDGLTCRKAHGMPFPEGITEEMYNVMCEYDSWLWHKLFGQKAFCFKAYEHGVQEVYKVLKSFTLPSSEEKPRIAFFSAHDNSIVSLISALELHVDKILPEYGTIVTFEVYQHKESKQYYVKVLFEGKPVAFAGHEPSALCAFEHFELRAKEFLKGP